MKLDMRALTYCRRTFVAAFGIMGLLALGAWKNVDVGLPIATICIGLSGANAYEGAASKKSTEVFGAVNGK